MYYFATPDGGDSTVMGHTKTVGSYNAYLGVDDLKELGWID